MGKIIQSVARRGRYWVMTLIIQAKDYVFAVIVLMPESRIGRSTAARIIISFVRWLTS